MPFLVVNKTKLAEEIGMKKAPNMAIVQNFPKTDRSVKVFNNKMAEVTIEAEIKKN